MSFYEEMYYNLPESERETFINSLSDEDRKSLMLALNKNNLCSKIVVLEKLEDYINLFLNKQEINKKSEEIKVNSNIKSDCNTNIDSNLYVEYVSECKNKLDSILELIKKFDYASKEDYRKSCEEIMNILDSENMKNKEELNKIIDNINSIYKNVYYKYYDKSSLSYRMDIEEEGIDYIRHIN